MGMKGYNAVFSVGAGPTVVAKAKNVEFDADSEVIDMTSREDAGWKNKEQGLKEWRLSGEQVWAPDDAAFEIIEAAYIAGTKIAAKWLDATSGHGWSGTVIVKKIGRSEPLNGGIMAPMEFEGSGALTREDPA